MTSCTCGNQSRWQTRHLFFISLVSKLLHWAFYDFSFNVYSSNIFIMICLITLLITQEGKISSYVFVAYLDNSARGNEDMKTALVMFGRKNGSETKGGLLCAQVEMLEHNRSLDTFVIFQKITWHSFWCIFENIMLLFFCVCVCFNTLSEVYQRTFGLDFELRI